MPISIIYSTNKYCSLKKKKPPWLPFSSVAVSAPRGLLLSNYALLLWKMLSFASQPERKLKSKELKKMLLKESGEQTKESALGCTV